MRWRERSSSTRLKASPSLTRISRRMTRSSVRVLPTMSMRSMKTRGPSLTSNVMLTTRFSRSRSTTGRDIDVGVADRAGDVRHRVDGVFDQVAAEYRRRVRIGTAASSSSSGSRLSSVWTLIFAELVANALIDREGDEEVPLVGRQFGDGGDDAEIGVAAVVVDIGAAARDRIRDDRDRNCRCFGRNSTSSNSVVTIASRRRAVGKLLVADEIDVANASDRAFIDFENQIDAVLVEFAHLRRHLRGEAAGAAIDFDDALHVGLRARGVNTERGRACTSSSRSSSSSVRMPSKMTRLMIGFSITDDDEIAAALLDLHVGEQAGGEQRLERKVDRARDRTCRRGGPAGRT